MKHFSVLFIAVLFFAACDKVPPRIPPPIPDCVLDTVVTIVKNNSATADSRKVLLEDYSGHRCGNCPPAAAKAEELAGKYNRLVVMVNHVTVDFAAPKKLAYREDFRNPASTEWNDFFYISGMGLPRGMVNRTKKDTTYGIAHANWESKVISELARPQSVKLDVTTRYDYIQKLLNIKVFTTFKTKIDADVYINFVLTMDSIVSDQTDYAPPAGVAVVDNDRRPDFRFDNIAVTSLNDTWGQLVKTGPVAANDTMTIRKECNLVGKCFFEDQVCTDDKRMSLVVFVYNATTKEILQVEKIKIR